jgi:F-type H+-transporting ATPase subunit delta
MRGRVGAELITATAIDASLQQRVVTTLEAALGQPVDLTAKVRPELIGGMLVRVGDAVYDASVVNQLGRLRDEAIASTHLAIQSSLERFAGEGA